MKHTPGSMSYQPSAGRHDFLIYDEATGADVALVRGDNEPLARLIAKAPEMRAHIEEAAQVSCECDDVPGGCFPCRSRALLAEIDGDGRQCDHGVSLADSCKACMKVAPANDPDRRRTET